MDRRQFLSSSKAISLLPVLLTPNWIDLPITAKSIEQLCDQILPPTNKQENEDYESLVCFLIERKYRSISEVKTVILKHLPNIMEKDREAVRRLRMVAHHSTHTDENSVFISKCGYNMPKDRRRLKKGVFFQHVGLIRECIYRESFGKTIPMDRWRCE